MAERDVIAPMLPAHISMDKFHGVVVTALNQNPDLIRADRRSLLNACCKAANDGLLPDGREGAFVIFNTKVKVHLTDGREEERHKPMVQWMPMVYGITKKALATGEVLSLRARVVYEKEIEEGRFSYKIVDGVDHVDHEPIVIGDRGKPVLAYAIATLASGIQEVEPLRAEDIAKIRSVSRAKNGDLWTKWEDEAWKKSAIRRLSKRVAFSPEIDQVIRREDELVDFNQDQDDDAATGPMTQNVTTAAALMCGEGFPGSAAAESVPVILEGEIITDREPPESAPNTAHVSAAAPEVAVQDDVPPPDEEPSREQMIERAKKDGREAAVWGTADLRKWWSGLAQDVQIELIDFKDKELKPLAEKNDLPVRA